METIISLNEVMIILIGLLSVIVVMVLGIIVYNYIISRTITKIVKSIFKE